ncbi:MAG: hypothetical protein JO152_01615 [Mycobacteriaceae bacterium]|nr:hypothetical protein [Mycobacteriaceae bacterium]
MVASSDPNAPSLGYLRDDPRSLKGRQGRDTERFTIGVAVGCGRLGGGAHHAPDFDIDEQAIGLTAEILARAALAKLGR